MERIVPEVVSKRPPSPEQFARELYGLHPEWQAYCWEAFGERSNGFLELKGGVYREMITKGPRKGQTNFRKPMAGTETTVAVPNPAYRAWRVQWERDTGYCADCEGTGQQIWGWSSKEGTRYRACPACGATGHSKPRSEVA